MRETLGQKVQRLRLSAGLTQRQLADMAGVPVTTLRGWEIDRREPGLRPAARLAKALGTTADDLADTVPVQDAGKAPRPAGPSKPQSPADEPATAHQGKPSPAKSTRRRRK